MTRPQVVSFPDSTDMVGLPADPFSIVATNDDGDKFRPAVVIALLNREMKRKLEKKFKAEARSQGLPEPIFTEQRPKLSEPETTARMADLLLGEWDKYHAYFPAETLSRFLDDRTSHLMTEAYRRGQPIDRDAVRRAIGQLWKESDAKRKDKH